MIPVLKPSVSALEHELLNAALDSTWWGQGPRCAEFEERIGAHYGRGCVTVNSATAALHLALLDLGVGPGDEVIVPALTFVSSGLAPLYVGARVVFCDIDPATRCLDWDHVRSLVTPHTAAVIAVDYAGYPAGRGTLLPVVQDAAHGCKR